MERKQARLLGLAKYNTGRNCRNGHLADRYTLSGACEKCLESYRNPKPKVTEINLSIIEREEILKRLYEGTAEIYLLVHREDIAAARDAAEALCLMRFPATLPSMLRTSQASRPIKGTGVSRIAVRVPTVDKEAMYEMGRLFLAARPGG